MANSSRRSPGGGPPTVQDALQQAHELVDNSQYHNANDLVEAVVASAHKHPAIEADDIDELQQKQSEFHDEVKVGRYVSASDLTETLNDIQAFFQ